MNIALFLVFGVLPSLAWLAYYLRADKHPEPNPMVLRVFAWGALATLPAVAIELGVLELFFEGLSPGKTLAFSLYMFFGVALTEELLKYGVVRWKVWGRKALDEPLDIPLYMIISALGFAALENVFILFGLGVSAPAQDIVILSALRFAGATFLHALVSGILGVFMALAQLKPSSPMPFVPLGLVLATLLHGVFNIYIIGGEGAEKLLVPAAVLLGLAVLLGASLSKLRGNNHRIFT